MKTQVKQKLASKIKWINPELTQLGISKETKGQPMGNQESEDSDFS